MAHKEYSRHYPAEGKLWFKGGILRPDYYQLFREWEDHSCYMEPCRFFDGTCQRNKEAQWGDEMCHHPGNIWELRMQKELWVDEFTYDMLKALGGSDESNREAKDCPSD